MLEGRSGPRKRAARRSAEPSPYASARPNKILNEVAPASDYLNGMAEANSLKCLSGEQYVGLSLLRDDAANVWLRDASKGPAAGAVRANGVVGAVETSLKNIAPILHRGNGEPFE